MHLGVSSIEIKQGFDFKHRQSHTIHARLFSCLNELTHSAMSHTQSYKLSQIKVNDNRYCCTHIPYVHTRCKSRGLAFAKYQRTFTKRR